MANYRVPVLLWQDYEGFYTAAPVETDLNDPPVAAVSTTSSGALEQVKQYLDWLCRESAWFASDFHDPQLVQVVVSLRSQYSDRRKVYPCEELIELRVPCVHGRRQDGLPICSMPTLGISFYLHDRREVKSSAVERLREELAGQTPQYLARRMAPASIRLEQVTVRRRELSKTFRAGPEIPTLQLVAQPLGKPSFRKRFAAAYQREKSLEDLVRRLGKEKAPVVLLGEQGSGKTSLLVNAVRTLERQQTPELDNESTNPSRHRYWQTTGARLISGMKYLGQWEARCESLIGELSEIDGVLCVESLIDLVLSGGSGPVDSIAAFLLPFLENGDVRLVAESTPEELDACRRLLPGLVDVFQILRLKPMSMAEARLALGQVSTARSRQSKIDFDPQVPETVCRLYQRYLPYQALPGRPADFLSRLFDRADQSQRNNVANRDIIERFLEETGLPEHLLRDEHPLVADDVQDALQRRVIGQSNACRAMAERIAALKAGMDDPNRPVGVFLFCGPTGVGKTQLAKEVSNYLFGHGANTDRLLRLDMSEYSAPWTAERLITKEDRSPSDFLSRVRQQPFLVVLLDEIEKATAEVFDLLLGLFDEGRLTDRFGRTTNFRSTILIMTSNLGASSQRSIGFSGESVGSYEAEARSFFRPEFFNRLDRVVTFAPLDRPTCLTIARNELDDISDREGLTKTGLCLTYSDRLLERLVDEGFDPRYGARPLQRVLESRVVATISRYLARNPSLRNRQLTLDLDSQHEVRIKAANRQT